MRLCFAMIVALGFGLSGSSALAGDPHLFTGRQHLGTGQPLAGVTERRIPRQAVARAEAAE